MKHGNDDIINCFVGTTQISRVMYANEIIWENIKWVMDLNVFVPVTATSSNFEHIFADQTDGSTTLKGIASINGQETFESKYEFINISKAVDIDTLVTDNIIADGDNLVIVKNDNSVNEMIASGVTVSQSIETMGNIGSKLTRRADNVSVYKDDSNTGSRDSNAYSTNKMPSRTWFFEILVVAEGVGSVGLSNNKNNQDSEYFEMYVGLGYLSTGKKQITDESAGSYGEAWGVGDVIGIGMKDNGEFELEFFKNGVSQGIAWSFTTMREDYYAAISFIDQFSESIIRFSGADIEFLPEGYIPYEESEYSMDTSVVTEGTEIPSKVFTVDAKIEFAISGEFVEPESTPSYVYANPVLEDTRLYKNLIDKDGSIIISPKVTLKSIGDKITKLDGSIVE